MRNAIRGYVLPDGRHIGVETDNAFGTRLHAACSIKRKSFKNYKHTDRPACLYKTVSEHPGNTCEKFYLEFEPSLKVRVLPLTVSLVPAGEFRENWYSPVWSTNRTPVYLTAKL